MTYHLVTNIWDRGGFLSVSLTEVTFVVKLCSQEVCLNRSAPQENLFLERGVESFIGF
jgi:hypothetical protein